MAADTDIELMDQRCEEFNISAEGPELNILSGPVAGGWTRNGGRAG